MLLIRYNGNKNRDGSMEQLLEWMEIIQDVRQYRKVDINFRGGAVTCTRHRPSSDFIGLSISRQPLLKKQPCVRHRARWF